MITQKTSTNKDEYEKLFANALIDLRNTDNMQEIGNGFEFDESANAYYEVGSEKTNKYEPYSIYCYYDEATQKYLTSTTAIPDGNITYYKPKAEVENGAPTSMSTLQEYFFYLERLVNVDEKYAVLPLDEAHFTIDANTRTISIPTDFRKNGIGVQGDDSAETLYFKINRFFDDMDFGRDDAHILIQWEAGNKSGVSPTFRKDITSDPDYVMFGWLLDKDICQTGSVKFSVRIIVWKDEQRSDLLYSFNTLTATVGVNNSLEFLTTELDVDDNISEKIKSRIKASPTPSQTIQLHAPVFVTPLKGDEYLDLVDGTATLTAQAYPNPQGQVQYIWYSNGLSNMGTDKENNKVFVKVDTTQVPNYNITYYTYKESDGTYEIRALNADENEMFTEEDANKTYQIVGTKEIDTAGTYTVGARATGTYMTSLETKSEHNWIVPTPKDIVLIDKTETSIVLKEENNDINAAAIVKRDNNAIPADSNNYFYNMVNYTWFKDGSEDVIQSDDNGILTISNPTSENQGYYTVQIKGTRNNVTTDAVTKTYKVTLPALIPEVTIPTTAYKDSTIEVKTTFSDNYQTEMGYVLTYEWYKVAGQNYDNVVKEMEKDDFDPRNFSTLFESDIIINQNSQYTIPSTGVYCCRVTNSYNTDEAFGVSNLCLVTG